MKSTTNHSFTIPQTKLLYAKQAPRQQIFFACHRRPDESKCLLVSLFDGLVWGC